MSYTHDVSIRLVRRKAGGGLSSKILILIIVGIYLLEIVVVKLEEIRVWE
jgi:hypothetical protein